MYGLAIYTPIVTVSPAEYWQWSYYIRAVIDGSGVRDVNPMQYSGRGDRDRGPQQALDLRIDNEPSLTTRTTQITGTPTGADEVARIR